MSAPSGLSQIRQVGGVFVRYPFLRYVVAGSVVVVLLLGILMVTLQRHEPLGEKARPASVAAAQSGEDPEERARREAEQRFRSTVGAPPSTSKTVAVRRGPSPAPVAKAAPGAKPVPAAVEPPPASTEPPSAAELTDEQQSTSKRFAEPERRVTAAKPGSSAGSATASVKSDNFSEADVRAVIKHNEASIKSCYERALKRDERLRTGRLDVNVTVGVSGMVKAVSVNAPPEFSGVSACVKEAVRRWRFPAGREEYEVPFPLLLHGTG
jgi:outer membrane biosynthesis protein TonB